MNDADRQARPRPPRPATARQPRTRPAPPPALITRPHVDLPPDAASRGRRIVQLSWLSTVVFCAVAIPAASGVEGSGRPAVITALVLFGISIPVWIAALVRGAVRTTEGALVDVPGLFFLSGSGPRAIKQRLFGSVVVCLTVGLITAPREPFAFLPWMLPFGLVGLWGARHGTYPPRPCAPARPGRRPLTAPIAPADESPIESPPDESTGTA